MSTPPRWPEDGSTLTPSQFLAHLNEHHAEAPPTIPPRLFADRLFDDDEIAAMTICDPRWTVQVVQQSITYAFKHRLTILGYVFQYHPSHGSRPWHGTDICDAQWPKVEESPCPCARCSKRYNNFRANDSHAVSSV